MNTQKPSTRYDDPEGRLKVAEIFGSIQGEGPYSGLPATFIRLAGCNLQCPNCDTDYTGHMLLHSHSIITKVRLHANHLVVITGGEPFLQNIGPLVAKLKEHGYHIQIETNGSMEPSQRCRMWLDGLPVDVVVSPKTPKINSFLRRYVTAFKYVIPGGDPLYALPDSVLGNATTSLAQPPKGFPPQSVFLQPEDGADQKTAIENMVRLSKTFGYRCSVQLHKILTVR
ncbi:MAG: 7-carboxy-7-deazaguanine synthase QueE [Synergistaceae bacterium]